MGVSEDIIPESTNLLNYKQKNSKTVILALNKDIPDEIKKKLLLYKYYGETETFWHRSSSIYQFK
jgi:ribosomal protein L30E